MLKRECFGLDKGPISQGARDSQDLKAIMAAGHRVQPLYLHLSWTRWEGAG